MRFVLGILFAASAFGQTGGALQPVPIQQPLDNAGRTLQGQCLYTYAAGTTTPQTTYSNSALSVPNTNPIVLNGFGREPAVYLSAVSYKIVLAYATTPGNCPVSPGTVIWSQDNVYDFGQLLKATLNGPTGAGQIGLQQPGGIQTNVGAALALCPDASQYASLTAAIANAVPSGCLNVSSVFTATAVTIPSNFVLNCQPGSSISNNTATPTITISGSASNVRLVNCNVSNSGSGTVAAIYSPSSCTNCTIQGGSVTATGGAPGIFFNGSWQNIHISNVAVSITGGANQSTAIALHCGPSGASLCDGGWVENNTIIQGNTGFGVEVGCFCNPPYPVPINIHVMHNYVTVPPAYSAGINGAVSMSLVTNCEVGGNTLNTLGTSPVTIGAYEMGTDHGAIHDNIWMNAPASGSFNILFVCGSCTNSTFHNNVGGGQAKLYSGGNVTLPGGFSDVTQVDIGGNILLDPIASDQAIRIECNGAMNNIDSVNIHDNIALGNASTTAGIFLTNDSSCSYSNITSENNIFDGFTYGALANGPISGLHYHHNTYLNISGSVYLGSQTPDTNTDNNQSWIIPQSVAMNGITLNGTAPTFTTGPAAGTAPTPAACLSSVICTPNRGAVFVGIGSSPPTGILFSINVPAGYFTHVPICTLANAPQTTAINPEVLYDNVGSTPTLLNFDVVTPLPAAAGIDYSYLCVN